MKQKYVVQAVADSDGIELMSDSPVGRRIYRPGDVIELDDTVSNVAGIKARGQIVELSEPAAEPIEEAPKSKGKVNGG